MSDKILYLGDTALNGPAAYLAGIMSHYNLDFDYLPSHENFSDSLLKNDYSTIIISDYPAKNFSPAQLQSIAQRVNTGLGLLMIGGWESFTGADRQYTDTILKEVLPVVMQDTDDRVNCAQLCLVEKACEHKIINSLPFEQNPPAIGGFNRLQTKAESTTILYSRQFHISRKADKFTFTAFDTANPLLICGSYGTGRVAALASDVAPHWVGGLVDWGDSRIEAQADGADPVEVGNWYTTLLINIINWTARKL